MSEHNEPASHPMDEIAQQFKASASTSPEQPALESVPPSDRSGHADPSVSGLESAQTADTTLGPLSLSPGHIHAPAFFVDKKLSVFWMAANGTDPFSQALSQELESVSTRNVFDILLRPAIKESIFDWQTFFSFVYIMLRRSTSQDTFDTGTVFISKDHIPATDSETSQLPGIHPFQVDSCMVGPNESATEPRLRIFGLEFNEGTLFMLRQDLWQAAATGDRDKEPAVSDIGSADEKKAAICILSARLNDSHRVADTMLPDVFFKLMNRIWDKADDVVRSFGGKRSGASGAQIDYVFAENAGRNPIFSAICCATRMNRHMLAMEEKLKAQQGWADEIRMNMGISHGADDQTVPAPNGCIESMVPGGAFDQSSHLAAVAGKGEIWITKNAVAQLPRKRIDQLVLGIDRQGRFFRNFFTRLSDLTPGVGIIQPKLDLGTLSIARVVRIENQRPDQPVTNEA